MTIQLLILATCLTLIVLSKAKSDILEERGKKTSSWTNKWDSYTAYLYQTPYTQPKENKGGHWWYFGLHTPPFKEKFPYSSTMLVFLTDKWHLWNSIRHRATDLAVSVFSPYPVLTFCGSMVYTSGVFHFIYNYLKQKKQ